MNAWRGKTGIIILWLFLASLTHAAPCGIHGDADRDSQEYTLNPFKNRSQAPRRVNPRITLTGLANGARFNNNEAAAIIGYVALVKPGGRETCNCHAKDEAHKDTHIALVTDPANANDKSKYIVVEVTPRSPATLSFPVHGNAQEADTPQARAGHRMALLRLDARSQCGEYEPAWQSNLARNL
jgi:hypothetical protein